MTAQLDPNSAERDSSRERFTTWEAGEKWQASERAWDEGAARCAKERPLRSLRALPAMPGIEPKSARWLKLKALIYLLRRDHHFEVLRKALRRPWRFLTRYLHSLFGSRAHIREGDFFLYGFDDSEAFAEALRHPDALLIAGFSYCHKPHECPAGRFTDGCIRDPENPVCRQCFIGKAINALPREQTIPLLIPTVHYIGGKVLDIARAFPHRRVLFLITACEMTLEMFGDWGRAAGVSGIGVRLDGRICNTMRAFDLSERGIKPGLTIVLPETQRRILSLIRTWRADLLQTKWSRR